MKKIFLILFTLVCISLDMNAQSWLTSTQAFFRRSAQARQISQQLSMQVEKSFEQACKVSCAHTPTNHLMFSGPSRRMRQPLYAEPTLLYPDASFITTPSQLSSHFLVQQNEAFTQEFPKMQLLQNQIIANLEDFEKHKQITRIAPEEIAPWLARQLPDDLLYLLLGEYHLCPEVQPQIAEIVSSVGKRFQNRQIILFTEFLMDGKIWDEASAEPPEMDSSKYRIVWTTAQTCHIPSIGLEPAFEAANDTRLYYRSPHSKSWWAASRQQNVWASLEGVRLRNEKWLKTLQEYRHLYPEALFIVYAGAAHVAYNEPYSIGVTLGGPKTRVISIYPNYSLVEETTLSTPFDKITEGRFANIPVLNFTNQKLSRLAGFDYSIKVLNFPND